MWPEAGLDTHPYTRTHTHTKKSSIVLLGNQTMTQFIVTMMTELSRLLFSSIWKQEIAIKDAKLQKHQ
jgi:hypothetical protein